MSTSLQPTQHPADETLAAFTDGRLDGAAREKVMAHMAVCDDCRAVWQATAEFRDIDRGENIVEIRFRVMHALAAAAALVVIVGSLLLVNPIRDRRLMGRVARAADAQPSRAIEARLAGGFDYRTPAKRYRSADATFDVAPALIEVQADAMDAAAKRPSPRNLHTAGVARLAAASSRADLDSAIRDLEAARARSAATDARLLSDLAAAYCARGSFDGSDDDYRQALADAEAALKVEKTPEALWNRALALGGLGRASEAIAAWDEYLKAEPAGPWADEARVRRQSLAANAAMPAAP